MGRNALLTSIFLVLAGCQSSSPPRMGAPVIDVPPAEGSWRAAATEQDRGRVRNWYASWEAALESARATGFGAEIDREGALLQPLAALPNAFLPAGEYRCRTIKVGAQGQGGLGFVAYDWFACRVTAEQGLSSLIKLTGSQRPMGLVFPDTLKRQIFLGTLELGDETMPVNYGTDRMRDMAGLIERVGDNRWRLVLPAPAYESLLDVIELVPVGA